MRCYSATSLGGGGGVNTSGNKEMRLLWRGDSFAMERLIFLLNRLKATPNWCIFMVCTNKILIYFFSVFSHFRVEQGERFKENKFIPIFVSSMYWDKILIEIYFHCTKHFHKSKGHNSVLHKLCMIQWLQGTLLYSDWGQ